MEEEVVVAPRGTWLVMMGDYAGAYSECKRMPACAAVP